ncbi:putative lipoprotein [Myxococcus xanthus DK 1622]|uniref:Lipoprotein n=2 Tax=Myxococcaceae TaxID=31 RepID=Q1D880_MYXXD|nr:putative lipoprotein [Myxococcus xanthus DK 1622]NOJ55165.1 hypothetical protein [Myxococcus xanthus]QPM82412.1 hypothetical protein I5Q59_14540 [Myxococcus xanthus]QVW71658.1 hypothetical protein JTM82_19885 [Myxococcus xanthus DZ2]UEO02211.1 hypothetical protein K1515_22910 [Myxococcus xanthus DZ2]
MFAKGRLHMKWEVKAGIAGLLFGSMLVGCGVAPEQGELGGLEDVTAESSASAETGLDAHRGYSTPVAVARYGHAVAYGDGKYFAVWADVRTGGIYGTRVKPDGTVLDPRGIRINFGEEIGRRPAIAFNGTHFFVVWDTINGVDGVRVKPDGTVVGPMFLAVQSDEVFDPARVACSPKICLVTYTVAGDDSSTIYFTRVSKDGVILSTDDHTLNASNTFADDASSTWNNSKKEFLVVWSVEQGGGPENADIYGNRVKEDGTILDGDGFPISTEEGAQTTPDVVWTGKSYQVVWTDDRNGNPDIYGARVSKTGTVKDPDGIPISTAAGAQTAPRIAHHNSKSLVVWDDTRYGPHSIWGARWGEDGDVWDGSGFPISSAGLAQQYLPDVAFGADKFFTIYAAQETYSPGDPHYIVGTRVTHQAQVKDVPAVPLTRRR